LEFKEFLNTMNITSLKTEEVKLTKPNLNLIITRIQRIPKCDEHNKS
jgi:hypothetical protein